MQPNVFETANAGFAQALYEDFLRDPASVSPEWRRLFESGQVGERPAAPTNGASATPVTNGAGTPSTPAATAPAAPAGATLIKGPALRLAQNMNESLTVPTATTFRELNVGVLDARRRDLNAALAAAGKGTKLSFTHLIAYALVQGIKKHPVMAHTLLDQKGETFRVVPDGIFLGLAVDVERKDGTRGLVVPVLKHAEGMEFAAFHAEYERIVEAARTNKLMPDAFAGATVSLTNPGGLGTSASVPRLMKGQGTIIATGAIGLPVAFAGDPKRAAELGVGKIMQMTSTYDHRIIQGAESGSFLRTIDQLLQGQESFYESVAASLGVSIPAGMTSVAPSGTKAATSGAPSTQPPAPSTSVSADALVHVAAAMGLVKAHRTHGHLAARLDPLGGAPPGDPALDPATVGLTPEVLRTIPTAVLRTAVGGATLADALPRLRETYCGTIAYEVEHISSHEERVWLREAIESGRYRVPLTPESQRALLQRLTEVETFEKFLHKAYLGAKRFSIEGVDMLVPMLDLAADLAAEQGAREVDIGMAHRGRLNVLVHNVGRPYESLFAKFEGSKHHPEDPDAGTGDVKYHLGAEGTHRTPSGKTVDLSLSPNPSHLEFVGPVVDGRARAKQTSRKGVAAQHDHTAAIPIVIHGDAAFAGQGVVAETLNLGSLEGYRTGGTLHLITNNQIGFTTDIPDSRSTRYASDLAKGFDIPIIHVNADDPEASLWAVRLAMAYRAQFANDVLIDLVGYRRHGHNEADEPAYTQPLMYERIKALPTVRAKYAERLAAAGVVSQADADAQAEAQYQKLVGLQQAMKAAAVGPAQPTAPAGVQGGVTTVETALSAALLTALNEELLAWPAGFTVHPKLVKQLERRRQVMGSEGGIDYGHAEALAFGSLLMEGIPIRLTGQDSQRGTFSHRHMVLHDPVTGATYTPVQNLKGALAPLDVFNSPLSELATMGFEYGYSVAAPESLVLWEGQFGDFVNGAQVILDQFIASGLSKWGLRTRLTLLLPHGYEGQGPEHSSARLERFLQLAAEGNIRVANCSTPAQYFHLLRRQARDPRVRPLVVMTPKSLLRSPLAASKLSDLTAGTFKPVLDDPTADASQVTRVILCSGKVYYDLATEAEKLGVKHPAVIRVEQLYPFPADELKAVLSRYPRASEVVWAQEEPRNMGAWNFVHERLTQLISRGMQFRYAGRPERASPAEGDVTAHTLAQKALVAEALAT